MTKYLFNLKPISMSYLINNQQKMNDLVFANRNKNYGAYALRSAYCNTLLKSLSLVIFGFATLMLTAYYLSKNPKTEIFISEQIKEVIYTIPVDLKKDPKPLTHTASQPTKKKPLNKPNASIASIKVTDSLVIETHTTNIENSLTSISENTSSIGMAETEGGKNGKGLNNDTIAGSKTEVKKIYEVDSQPEFEGGMAALYKFVSSRLKYPGRALDDGIQGTVFVKFVVDEKGKVGNLSLVNNLGYGLDDEAMRVVAMIPNFKTPAKSNGEPVKVYFQLPIRFKYK
jgi:periplasmic protein TonB